MPDNVQVLKAKVDGELARLEDEKAALFRKDGSPRFADVEHNERMQAIVEEMRRVAGEIIGEIDELIVEREGDVHLYQDGDPTSDLLDQQLEQANSKRVFVAEDCEHLPLDQLLRRLKGVRAKDDTVLNWLYARYIPRRISAEEGKLATGELAPETAAQTAGALRTLREISTSLKESTKSSFKNREASKAQADVEALRATKLHIRRRLYEADGTEENARAESRRATVSRI